MKHNPKVICLCGKEGRLRKEERFEIRNYTAKNKHALPGPMQMVECLGYMKKKEGKDRPAIKGIALFISTVVCNELLSYAEYLQFVRDGVLEPVGVKDRYPDIAGSEKYVKPYIHRGVRYRVEHYNPKTQGPRWCSISKLRLNNLKIESY